MKIGLEQKLVATMATLLVVGVATAGIMAVAIQKETLYTVAESGAENIAALILQDIETTMLEGKADITRRLIRNISSIRGIEHITVFNAEGREAFGTGSPVQEAAALAELG